MIYCILAVIVVIFALVLTIIYLNTKNKELKQKVKEKDEFLVGAMKELEKLKAELKIRQEERSEADKKVDELHNGDSVSNAIYRLSKH